VTGEFDPLYCGATATLETADGRAHALRGDRWSAEPDEADWHLLAACRGPALDIGCGPGRLTAELAARGAVVLGIDTSPLAVRMTSARRAPALRRDVFGPLPAEGRWREVLLVDGNIGIGGDPEALLRRVRTLLSCGGVAVVEVEPPGAGLWSGTGRVVFADRPGELFRWAVVGAEAIEALAPIAGFTGTRVTECSGRWFAWLNVTCPRC
jgi:SAM-dependent methyltransferase